MEMIGQVCHNDLLEEQDVKRVYVRHQRNDFLEEGVCVLGDLIK